MNPVLLSVSGFSTGLDMEIVVQHIFSAFDGNFDADVLFGCLSLSSGNMVLQN